MASAQPSPAKLGEPDLILIRYGELALKKGNRGEFEKTLARNLRQALASITKSEVDRQHGRIFIRPERRCEKAAKRAAEVFGVKTVSPVWTVAMDVEAITAQAAKLLDSALAARTQSEPVSFRVRVKRSNKAFPLNSSELERHVAERILPGPEKVKVQLVDPEMTLGIEVRDKNSFVFLDRFEGPGGLPVGTLGRALCLLSGGIDSPVASWLAMKRGLHMGYVSFHSAPYIGEGFRKKVREVVRALGRWQYKAPLFTVPFADIQVAIRDQAPERYRTVLYRRMMQRIAERISAAESCGALVTGECLGQVASQTLENLTCIGAATSVPVLRPVLTFDKEEIIRVARRIGTFDISIQPEPDCCTVFQPSRPVIRGRLEDCLAAEAQMDVEGLVQRALDGTEMELLDHEGGA
ncbi:MAG: tRNA uracil 4-sulfurtransferase ThiI [Planctomycetota bacterium]|jgi:thiamine biosynthesis protein ThiI|nr:tRNA 4-thiouridine(8) synthase ThiI [Candidatus Woesearchaeota archaeon]MDP6386281.1 tRNA uracil 4-sulfurtransferase ThiI [Planctomycetota bacterium]MDP6739347.1 tRNA uracil 4-sulfurtransferase ThiI [Planctomycetota bacterium]MDP6938507.1 tRNA uracil 4-sulfurtransferase ThiI [Planctomycetota bacterium]